MAARCRVPSSVLNVRSSVSGNKQPAARIRPSRMISAPSWSGVLGTKIFLINSRLNTASIKIPVSTKSLRPTSRSKTIRAPVCSRDITRAAAITSLMAISISSSLTFCALLKIRPRPNCSKARRSSGWNTTGNAKRRTVILCCKIQLITYRFSKWLNKFRIANITRPFKRETARVSLSNLYK